MSREQEEEVVRRTSKGKKNPVIKGRTTYISRSRPGDNDQSMYGGMSMGYGGMGGGRMSMSGRQSYSPMFAPGTMASASQEGVSKVINNSAQEKSQFQDLNSRLASYIENAKFQEAQKAVLYAALEAERKKKGFDPTELKELYENEIEEFRDILKKMNEEKADADAERADLMDRYEDEKDA